MDCTVNVGLVPRGIAGMKIIGRAFNKDDAHIVTQISVDCITKFRRRYRALELHICDLALRMYSGIGAPRSMNSDWSIIQQRKHARQFALNSAQFALHLPAVKVCTVILKEQSKVHFGVRRLVAAFMIFRNRSAQTIESGDKSPHSKSRAVARR